MDLTERGKRLAKQAGQALPSKKTEKTDEIRLAALIDGRLSELEAESVWDRLASDPEGLEALATYRALQRVSLPIAADPSPKLVETLMARRIGQRPGTPLMEVVVQFARQALEVLRQTADTVQGFHPAYAGMRSPGLNGESSLATFRKEMGHLSAEIEIERIDTSRGEVTVRARRSGGAPLAGLRVSLYEDSCELESLSTSGGEAVFHDLRPGRYRFELSENNRVLGQISLEVMGDRQ